MKAVNLIPGDQRGGGSVGAGRSGGVAYAVLAVLAVVAIMIVLYGKARREVAHKQAQIATLTTQSQHVEAEANTLAPYTTFAALREQRTAAVEALVDSRFDWAHAFHEFGRVLGPDVAINSLDGAITAAPASATTSTASPGGAAATTSVASVTPPGSVPTFQMSGCAKSQDDVALMLQNLRLIDGVSEVALTSSTKSSSGGGTASASAASAGGCAATDPVFAVTITFDALPSTTESAAAVKTSSNTTVSDTSSTGGGS